MDYEHAENTAPEQEIPAAEAAEKKYVPRPVWQVWAARVGLVVFVAFLIMYYILVSRGA